MHSLIDIVATQLRHIRCYGRKKYENTARDGQGTIRYCGVLPLVSGRTREMTARGLVAVARPARKEHALAPRLECSRSHP